ncbi:MAG TPA: efflux RND transporter periplasmic adaptor subunit [Synechococcales cyanobacterium M55_K2018_004]|nr:efflux RND transporter periplasmic adaptor subunit [Synechococcales cyanobacterium M55_K2018_004]
MKQLPPRPSTLQDNVPAVAPRPRRAFKLPLKRLLYVALGVGALVLVATLLRPTPPRVETATIQRGDLLVTVEEEGKTRVRDRYQVAAETPGYLNRITLKEGDAVKQGDVVAQIDALPSTTEIQQALAQLQELRAQRAGVATQRPKTAALEQARSRIDAAAARQQQANARVAQAKAALEQARRDRQRNQELAAAGAISQQSLEAAQLAETTRARELDAAELEANAAAAAVQVARNELTVLQQEQRDPDYLLRVYDARIASTEAQLTRLRNNAERTEIRSPITGRVLRIHQESAQYVASGTLLMEIANPNQLELVIDVLSSDALTIKPGDPIRVVLGSEMEPLAARVKRIEPAAFTKVSALGVEEQRVNVIGEFVNPPQNLGDGYRVDAAIAIWQGRDVVKVPISAIFRCGGDRWCTFVAANGRANQRQIEIGRRSSLEAEVLHGLTVGDRVILHPSGQIRDQQRIR